MFSEFSDFSRISFFFAVIKPTDSRHRTRQGTILLTIMEQLHMPACALEQSTIIWVVSYETCLQALSKCASVGPPASMPVGLEHAQFDSNILPFRGLR